MKTTKCNPDNVIPVSHFPSIICNFLLLLKGKQFSECLRDLQLQFNMLCGSQK